MKYVITFTLKTYFCLRPTHFLKKSEDGPIIQKGRRLIYRYWLPLQTHSMLISEWSIPDRLDVAGLVRLFSEELTITRSELKLNFPQKFVFLFWMQAFIDDIYRKYIGLANINFNQYSIYLLLILHLYRFVFTARTCWSEKWIHEFRPLWSSGEFLVLFRISKWTR